MQPVLIYSPYTSPRLEYMLQWVFGEQWSLSWMLTNNWQEMKHYTGAALNYSNEPAEGIPQIANTGFLAETDIMPQQPAFIRFENMDCPFAAGTGLLPFDVFAAAFFLLSRYEEYLPHEKNRYGQFIAANSMAARHGFLQKPAVDIWLMQLGKALQAAYPGLQLGGRQYRSLFTYDIDTAFAYKGRSLFHRAGAALKDVLAGNRLRLRERKAVLNGRLPDPYDTYPHITAMQQQYGHETLYFFLAGNRGGYNRNLHYQHPEMNRLIMQTAAEQPVGIHPSYHTYNNPQLIRREMERLRQITGRPVTQSRQHYLRMEMPQTFEHLAACGITHDYSMGYAETPGFRAGTCNPFYFFNLQTNAASKLLLHPFTYMEGSFAEDMALQPEAALPEMLRLIDEVKTVNGCFICIWHNHSLCDAGFWKGWKFVHDETARAAAPTS